MWTSNQSKKTNTAGHAARMGIVTAGGEQAGVYIDAERRWLPVAAPGGYRWRPRAGEQVLVLKTGADGESACILARQEDEPMDLQPGEVELTGPGCGVKLTGSGQVALSGTVTVNGLPLEVMIQNAVAQAAAALAGQEE
ncbi:MAG: hypothetical protein J6A62_05175 [Oscillospiraceae bacterium]|nr:hypothetical protein [Oscillospiraceae bacterium]